MTKQIPLGHDLFATVDEIDFEILSKRKWHAIKPVNPKWPTYAGGWATPPGKSQDRMHRLIMNPLAHEKVIHRDGNGLNNTRSNLVVVSSRESHFHSQRSSRNTSGAKGVSFNNRPKIQRRWRAYIHSNGKMVNLGNFASFDEALASRKKAESELFGSLARDLPIGEGDPSQPRVLNVTWFPPEFHRLTEINPQSRTAVCSVCGPVKVRSSEDHGEDGTHGWKCITKAKETRFKHRKQHNRKRDLLRRPHMAFKKDHCERCGFVAEHTCQLDMHHKDYDAKNNSLDNLETLCSNCHRLETQRKRDEIFLQSQTLQWVGTRRPKANFHKS